eukprot:COSAG02_NODE_24_length_52386_cov_726.042898_2_plen_149_part_00
MHAVEKARPHVGKDGDDVWLGHRCCMLRRGSGEEPRCSGSSESYRHRHRHRSTRSPRGRTRGLVPAARGARACPARARGGARERQGGESIEAGDPTSALSESAAGGAVCLPRGGDACARRAGAAAARCRSRRGRVMSSMASAPPRARV